MIKKVPQGLLLALICFTLPAVAVADSMLNAFELAIDSDPDLKAAQAGRKAMLEEHAQTLAKYFPTVTVYSHVGKVAQDLKEVAFADESILGNTVYNEVNFGIALTQPVFNLTNFRNRNVSEVQLVQAELQYRISQEALLFRVAERYFGVLGGQDALNFARAEKNAIARQLRQTKERFKIGLTAVTDVHEAQARHDMALAQEIKAESELANDKEVLRRV
ncbi:MAG: TolC family protein, partial [Gammaproteobacteria bacterium]|nr:TolC family protein [Gammaproteobacteria bacterium]